MNKGIAHILMNRLSDLPFIQKFGGVVTTLRKDDVLYDEEGARPRNVTYKFPATTDYIITKEGCGPLPETIDFIPDDTYTGMLFFQDNGVEPAGRVGKFLKFRSKLRVIIWLNITKIQNEADGDKIPFYSLPVMLLAAMQGIFSGMDGKGEGFYHRIFVKLGSMPVQDESVFNVYSFEAKDTQYLMAPYDAFAVDLDIEYCMSPDCVMKIDINDLDQTAIIWDEDNKESILLVDGCEGLSYQ